MANIIGACKKFVRLVLASSGIVVNAKLLKAFASRAVADSKLDDSSGDVFAVVNKNGRFDLIATFAKTDITPMESFEDSGYAAAMKVFPARGKLVQFGVEPTGKTTPKIDKKIAGKKAKASLKKALKTASKIAGKSKMKKPSKAR